MTITEHIAAVRREMAEAARESGRSERDIILVGASKMNDAAACQEAIAAGVDALGENRVQEMTAKLAENAYDGAPLHFISATRCGRWWARPLSSNPSVPRPCCGRWRRRLPGSSWCRISCWR